MFYTNGQKEYGVNTERDDGEEEPLNKLFQKRAGLSDKLKRNADDSSMLTYPTLINAHGVGQSDNGNNSKEHYAQSHKEKLARRPGKFRFQTPFALVII